MTPLETKLATLAKDGDAVRRTHPDDVADQEKSIAWARVHGPVFVRAHAEALGRMVTTYGDKEAREMLELLREAFWSTPQEDRSSHATRKEGT